MRDEPGRASDGERGLEVSLQQFVAFLRKRRMKVTQERLDVARGIFEADGHFDAEDLLIRLRRQGRRVSKATIYRTLPLLIEGGLLRQAFLAGEKQTYYENTLGLKHHEHLICISCGRVIEFTSHALETALQVVADRHMFASQRRRIEIFGFCEECA